MRVLVTEREIEELRYGRKVGNGKEGICYFSEDDNKVVKIFHDWHSVYSLLTDKIKHSQIAYPIDILYDKEDNLRGYTMYFLGGQKFKNGFPDNLNLEELKSLYRNLKDIILSMKDIYMDDNCLDNMLLDQNLQRINLIDTSRWYEKVDGHLESVNEFNWQMINALLENIDWKHFKLNQDKQLFELHMVYEYLENIPSLFIDFLNELEIKVSEERQEKVKTIKDLKI